MPNKLQEAPKKGEPRLRVLIADDKAETRRSTRLMLTLIPEVEVVALAQNGQEAIELARQHRPDIALMDVNMPGLNGLEAIAAMRRQQPGLACVVISAEQQRRTFSEAMAVGARGFITKPFTSDQLVEVMTRVGNAVKENRQHTAEVTRMQRERDTLLHELAYEYVKAQRMDDKARIVYEKLAQDRACDQRILISLAMIYLTRRDWSKLKRLVARLEQMTAA
jgi:YesN/AraC family two-component response regulator